MINTIFEVFQSLCLIISSVLIIMASIGILRLKNDMDKVIYARLHFLGVVDIAGVLAMIGLNQPLLAGIYFILAPIVGHAMANAYYYGEDEVKDDFVPEKIPEIEDKDEKIENNVKKEGTESKKRSENNSSKNNNISLNSKFKEEHLGNQDEQYSISKLNIINEDK
ncbi:MAG: monovalent cation/H(+) antiporter subunit G [Methanobrevibacter sp.]|nr:monovalent cation/H(+) antiporter subunit G [Candidatus Methanovirga australis]